MTAAVAIREKHDGEAGRASVRLWLRLLSCTTAVEKRVQRMLEDEHGATLPRFDVLAALDREPDGMSMGALSRALLVSNGNVTQLVQRLAADDLVRVEPCSEDRRRTIVRITALGRQRFAEWAAAHHALVDRLLGALSQPERDTLFALLGRVKASIGAGA